MCWSLKPWINTLLCVCVCIEPLMLPALLKSFASFLGQCRCYYYYSGSHFFRGDRWCKKGIHTGVLCCQAVELAWTTACCLAPEPHWFTATSSVSPVPFLGFFPLEFDFDISPLPRVAWPSPLILWVQLFVPVCLMINACEYHIPVFFDEFVSLF